MKKLPEKLYNFVFAFFMSSMISCLMSGVVTWRNLGGFPEDYFAKWMAAWATAFTVAFPMVMIVAPIARRMALAVANNPFPQMAKSENDR